MLDAETKRRIDTARDVLVGKVPDPKSQVEQITIALIYKFMDDIDAESEEFGGKRTFFASEFARFGWAKLMHHGLGGHEMLNLYAEAIERMDQNPGIPQLFRDIFSNAFLPYRDPETLRAFLKVIDGFTYDHSERLGDAFEYLLSVMDSQGDAGQFRTPRHIIDFIVSIVDPKKDEIVLDPACGTAGFLISSYKHILAANIDADGNSTLTPDDRARLARNFTGYDISPDMVRLSLVNMYLHGFVDPHIFEYDTLTSEERWDEFADVVLANPPFMSPKGGIRPHNRFSIKSKRSEVLFVDYMAEHLNTGGRAGIIVPEGIIFQSQNAHKRLRKKLVEESLVAVVSLPAGVFNPYSGVKTSILLLDKGLARRTDRIAFFKVENDGYDLGAQRRPIDKNDLPRVRGEIGAYIQRLREGDAPPPSTTMVAERGAEYTTAGPPNKDGLTVERQELATEGEYSLSGERYRVVSVNASSWPFAPVKELFERSVETVQPRTLTGTINYVGLENISQNTGKLLGQTINDDPASIKSLKSVFEPDQILYGKLRPNLNKVWLADCKGICSTDIYVIKPKTGKVNPNLYSYIFRNHHFNKLVLSQVKGAQLPRIGWNSLANIQIPLPPLEVQQEIVAEIEGYQKVIDGARAVVENYRPHIHIDPDWPLVELGELCETKTGKRDVNQGNPAGEYPFFTCAKEHTFSDSYSFDTEALLIAGNGDVGSVKYFNGKFEAYQRTYVLTDFKEVDAKYLYHSLDPKLKESVSKQKLGNTMPYIRRNMLREFLVPLPPPKMQQKILAEIEAEQGLVDANRELIGHFEEKIQVTLSRVWEGPASNA
ncbi:MAG: N-6 DNA methylase [Caldilineaceae bacterium]|nr:N-6 DNA methylase [Caldilineaceae bacterium]